MLGTQVRAPNMLDKSQTCLPSPLLFYFYYIRSLYVYSEVTCKWHTNRGQRTTCRRWFSFPHVSSRDWTQVLRPGSVFTLYPMDHLHSPTLGFVKSLSLTLYPSLLGGSRLRTKHIIFLKIFIILRVWVLCLHATCTPNAHWGQKRASKPPDLELQMFLSCHVGTRYWFWILCMVIQGC